MERCFSAVGKFSQQSQGAFCAEVEEGDTDIKKGVLEEGPCSGPAQNSRDSSWWQRGAWGAMRPGGPLFLREQRGLQVPRWCTLPPPGGSRPGPPGTPGLAGAGGRQRAGLAASTPPRQVQHHRVSPGDRRGRHSTSASRTRAGIGRTWRLPLHLWFAAGNLLSCPRRRRLWKVLKPFKNLVIKSKSMLLWLPGLIHSAQVNPSGLFRGDLH